VSVSLNRHKPHWGARKIRALLVRRLDQDLRIPVKSAIHAVLHRHRLVKGLRRPRRRASGTEFSAERRCFENAVTLLMFPGLCAALRLGNARINLRITCPPLSACYVLDESLESADSA
jgi:hypothetical protein